MNEKKMILDACCGSRMFWFDKENPLSYLLTSGMKNTLFVMVEV